MGCERHLFATFGRRSPAARSRVLCYHSVGTQQWGVNDVAPTSFAIPFGQSQNWPADAADAAREVGYTDVYAQAEATRPPGTIARTFVTQWDGHRIFRAALGGAFDRWEE